MVNPNIFWCRNRPGDNKVPMLRHPLFGHYPPHEALQPKISSGSTRTHQLHGESVEGGTMQSLLTSHMMIRAGIHTWKGLRLHDHPSASITSCPPCKHVCNQTATCKSHAIWDVVNLTKQPNTGSPNTAGSAPHMQRTHTAGSHAHGGKEGRQPNFGRGLLTHQQRKKMKDQRAVGESIWRWRALHSWESKE